MRSIFVSRFIMLVATTAAAQDFTWSGWASVGRGRMPPIPAIPGHECTNNGGGFPPTGGLS